MTASKRANPLPEIDLNANGLARLDKGRLGVFSPKISPARTLDPFTDILSGSVRGDIDQLPSDVEVLDIGLDVNR